MSAASRGVLHGNISDTDCRSTKAKTHLDSGVPARWSAGPPCSRLPRMVLVCCPDVFRQTPPTNKALRFCGRAELVDAHFA